jgi:hypothetical protein
LSVVLARAQLTSPSLYHQCAIREDPIEQHQMREVLRNSPLRNPEEELYPVQL